MKIHISASFFRSQTSDMSKVLLVFEKYKNKLIKTKCFESVQILQAEGSPRLVYVLKISKSETALKKYDEKLSLKLQEWFSKNLYYSGLVKHVTSWAKDIEIPLP